MRAFQAVFNEVLDGLKTYVRNNESSIAFVKQEAADTIVAADEKSESEVKPTYAEAAAETATTPSADSATSSSAKQDATVDEATTLPTLTTLSWRATRMLGGNPEVTARKVEAAKEFLPIIEKLINTDIVMQSPADKEKKEAVTQKVVDKDKLDTRLESILAACRQELSILADKEGSTVKSGSLDRIVKRIELLSEWLKEEQVKRALSVVTNFEGDMDSIARQRPKGPEDELRTTVAQVFQECFGWAARIEKDVASVETGTTTFLMLDEISRKDIMPAMLELIISQSNFEAKFKSYSERLKELKIKVDGLRTVIQDAQQRLVESAWTLPVLGVTVSGGANPFLAEVIEKLAVYGEQFGKLLQDKSTSEAQSAMQKLAV